MERQKLFLISSHSGPRLRYVATQVVERWLGVQIVIATPTDLLPEGAIRIGYGVITNSVSIPDSGFLRQTNFSAPDFDFEKIRKVNAECKTDGFAWNADILSLIFQAISRIEEYRKPELADTHGRFPENQLNSIRFGFQDFAFVDTWVFTLGQQLISLGLKVNPPRFVREVTLDIDNPTAFHQKGFLRNSASIAHHFLTGKFSNAWERLGAVSGWKKDPFFTFDKIDEVCKQLNINPIHFIWIGNYGPNDKGLHFENPFFQTLVKRISNRYPVGLHPSYQSFGRPEQLQKEKTRLEQLTNQPVTKSRQHYLRLRLPETYRQLIELGIRDEYSMGFSSSFGFRAGTSNPFLWYDVENEQQTGLTIHPFSMMDSTALHQLKLTPEQFQAEAEKMANQLQAVGGQQSLLFHNESFGGKMEWQGWENVFETAWKIGR